MLPTMQGRFRAGGDAELRFTPSGQAVANFSIIANSAKKDPSTQEWVETGSTGWIRVNAWGALAERCANDVTKGCEVFVVGRYQQREYDTREGDKGTSIELTADAVEVIPKRDDQGGQQRPAQQQAAPGADPWAIPSGGAAGQGYAPDEPPF